MKESIKRIYHNYFQKYDGEKQELYSKIRILKIELAKAQGKKGDENLLTQHVSLFEEGASGLSFIDNPEDDKDHMLNRLQNEINLLTQEYRETKNE